MIISVCFTVLLYDGTYHPIICNYDYTEGVKRIFVELLNEVDDNDLHIVKFTIYNTESMEIFEDNASLLEIIRDCPNIICSINFELSPLEKAIVDSYKMVYGLTW
jgi:hypothetical protein